MYEWREWTDDMGVRWRGLLPDDESNNYSLKRIASVYRRGDGKYVGAYNWASTGCRIADSVVTKTVRGAQRFIERRLSSFWVTPTIRNPIT